MHILQVWPYWDHPEVPMESLIPILERGHQVSVMLGDLRGVVDGSHWVDRVPIHVIPRSSLLSGLTGTPYPVFRMVKRWIRMIDPDIVHVHSHLFLSCYQVVQGSHSLGLPSVVSVHGFTATRNSLLDLSQRIYIRTIAKMIFERASSVMCLTRSDAMKVARIIGNHNKIFLIPNSVDSEFFKPSGEREHDLVAWVGKFLPEKGLSYLLRAMGEILEGRPSAKLVLSGEGIQRVELESLVHRLGISEGIAFQGWLNREGVAGLLRKASVYAFPSLSEGQPRSILEAMASGVPVVGSDIPGISDIVGHGESGILVPPRDSHALAASILMLLEDDKMRKRMGGNARRAIIRRHSRASVAQSQDQMYRETIERFTSGEQHINFANIGYFVGPNKSLAILGEQD